MKSAFMGRSYFLTRSSLSTGHINQRLSPVRFMSFTPQDKPSLTALIPDEPVRTFLNPFKFWYNVWQLHRFKNRYDSSFRLDEFQFGARKAFIVVSQKLYEGDFDGMSGLVTENLLGRLRRAVESLPSEKREKLNVRESDVYAQMVLGAGFEKSESSNVFGVLLACHCYHGAEQEKQPSLKQLAENKDKFIWANVRFSRSISDTESKEWTIDYLNYSWF